MLYIIYKSLKNYYPNQVRKSSLIVFQYTLIHQFFQYALVREGGVSDWILSVQE